MNSFKFLYIFFVLSLLVGTAKAANYYWVGGSGNWGDLNHWATTSGGSTYYATVPGSADNVIFDASSGFGATNALKTVTVNVPALAGNFTINGAVNAPIIAGAGSTTLNVYGNMLLQSGVLFNAPVSFKPVGVQTATLNGVAFNNNVSIDGAGTLRLLDNAKVNNAYTLTLISGTFDTDGKQLDAGALAASGTASKTLMLGSSQVYIATGALFHTGTNLNIQPGTSHLHFTGNMDVNLYNAVSKDGLSGANALSFYDVTFENPNSTWAGINPNTNVNGIFTFLHNLTFKGVATLQKNAHTIANLFLATGKSLTLPSGATQTITQSINLGTVADGCAAYSNLRATSAGAVANMKMMAGAMANVYHTSISDIAIARDANPAETFNAQLNSYNAGGNTGWNFTAPISQTYYWIGGAGNWSDNNHWSLTSGGTLGTCVPSLNDDVVFDNASGFTAAAQVVNVDMPAACRNISFIAGSNPPTVSAATGNNISVTGSAIWQSGMLLNTTVSYATRGNQTITSNNVKHVNVNIAGRVAATDKITLVDDFESTASVTFAGGTFNTNNKKVTLLNFYGNAGGASSSLVRGVELTASHIYVTGSVFDTGDTQVSVAGGTSVIHFTKQLTGSSEGLGALYTQQYYDVIFENPATTNTTAGMIGNSFNTSFHNVTFRGNGRLQQGRYNSITLSPGKAYDFTGGQALIISESFNARSTDCSQPVTIGSTNALQFILSMPATASVNVQNAIISNSKGQGGANFVALNSTDVVSNTGWTFPANSVRRLYWVGGAGTWTDNVHWSLTSGGAGGECMPDLNDDVFFDANSGFTAASKTVTIPTMDTFVHNFTINGTSVPPTFSGGALLAVYGSMVLQNGISWNILTEFRPATGMVETLTSNGGSLTFAGGGKRASINGNGTLKLADDAIFDEINLLRGTFDTDGKTLSALRIFDWYAPQSTTTTLRTLKLNNSRVNISIANNNWAFMMVLPGTKLEAGTSKVYFTGSFTGTPAITLASNMDMYDVYFTNPNSTMAGLSWGYGNSNYANTAGSNTKFNSITFMGGGYINTVGNSIGTLVLTAGKTYQFRAGAEQFVTNKLYASGNPCKTITLKSTTSGSQASLNVQGGLTLFDYGILTDINASGNTLTYGINSSDGGNNSNIVFDHTGTQGTIVGFGPDWLCHIIDPALPVSYTLNTNGFYADPNTTFSWIKVGSPTVLGTGPTLDISASGYGTYKVTVTYATGCTVSDDVLVQQGTVKPTAAATQKFCGTVYTSLASLAVTGNNIKWYTDAVSTTVLPASTLLIDGHTYYVTQTVNNGCESVRLPVTVVLENCAIANPSIRNRVSN